METEIDTETRVNTLVNFGKAYTYNNLTKEEAYLAQILKVANGEEALEMEIY